MERFKANGESHKALMEMIVNEIRENRQECKDIMDILRTGEGKICSNKESINRLWWSLGTGVTILVAFFGWTIFGG
jgi:hypothetical protein